MSRVGAEILVLRSQLDGGVLTLRAHYHRLVQDQSGWPSAGFESLGGVRGRPISFTGAIVKCGEGCAFLTPAESVSGLSVVAQCLQCPPLIGGCV